MEDGGCACFVMGMLENIGRRTKKLSKLHPTIVAKFSFLTNKCNLACQHCFVKQAQLGSFSKLFAMGDI